MSNSNRQNEVVYVQSPSTSTSAMAEMLNSIMPILMLGIIKDVLKH